MKLISLKIKGFKNLDFWDNKIDFTKSEGISIFVGNNGSGKSNVLEAISAIFYGLYNKEGFDPKFEFELVYRIEYISTLTTESGLNLITEDGFDIVTEDSFNKCEFKIKYEDNFLSFYINGENKVLKHKQINNYLPSQIIALYSGEETRLYEKYFKEYYQNFIFSIKNNKLTLDGSTLSFDTPKMIFINKDFWNIALLTILVSIYDFETDELYKGLENILGKGIKINEIEFDINQENLDKFKQNNVTNFVKILSSKNDRTLDSLREFQDTNQTIGTHQDFFWHLSIACFGLTENDKLINNIILKLDNNITLYDLSEGQKKQLLIYFVTNLLVSNNSLVLLDEPDSYIHVGNKQKLKNLFENYLLNFNGEGEVIMTTHSPTLMNKFDKKHLFYLENGKLDDKNKAEILNEITGDNMSYAEQQIILNTNKDILIVEGKTDEIYIKTALEKLKENNSQYKDLDFEFIPAGGADGIQLFMNKFIPKEGQKIMVFFDRDDSGWKGLEKILGKKINNKNNFTFEIKDGYYVFCYPKKTGFSTDIFVIEDYFDLKLFTDFLLKDSKCFQDIPKKDNRKTDFANECKNFDKSEFEGFKVLFDIILSF